jgi:hypothetical protein
MFLECWPCIWTWPNYKVYNSIFKGKETESHSSSVVVYNSTLEATHCSNAQQIAVQLVSAP